MARGSANPRMEAVMCTRRQRCLVAKEPVVEEAVVKLLVEARHPNRCSVGLAGIAARSQVVADRT